MKVYYTPKEVAHRHSSDRDDSASKIKQQEEEPNHSPNPEESAFRDIYDVGQIIGQYVDLFSLYFTFADVVFQRCNFISVRGQEEE